MSCNRSTLSVSMSADTDSVLRLHDIRPATRETRQHTCNVSVSVSVGVFVRVCVCMRET